MFSLEPLRAALARRWARGRAAWTRLPRVGATSLEGWRRAAVAAGAVAVLAAILAGALLPPTLELRAGDVAPVTVKAPRDFVDRAATEAARQAAAARVPEAYAQDPAVLREAEDGIDRRFARARAVREQYRAARAAGAVDAAEWAARLAEEVGLRLTDEVALAVLGASDRTLGVLRQGAREVAAALMAEGIKPEGLEAARQRVPALAAGLGLDRPYEAFVNLLVQAELRANLFFDRETTERARRAAAESVQPVLVRRGEVIVREGEVVRPEQIERLRDAGLLGRQGHRLRLVGVLLLSALAVGVMATYLQLFEPRVYRDAGRLLALAVAGLGALAAVRALAAVPALEHASPLAAGSMLSGLLTGPRLAVVYTAVAAPLAALIAGGEPVHALAPLTGGLVAAFALGRVGGRTDLVRAGLRAGVAQLAVIAAEGLAAGAGQAGSSALWRDALAGAGGGLLAGMLTAGSLPLLEGAFGIVTPIRLLELGNPNHPLLRRLLLEAPGTYHHSLMVANLCEAAVEQVGGDSLLARVGAYYHDAGKLRRPAFFIENQFGADNPHDRLSPNLSALIITSHVKDGVELARAYGLPREIIRFIEEHHGTLRVEYFYRKAEEAVGDQGVMVENFRYPGPEPTTRETAICMLADGCEAAVRAMARPSPARIETVVRKVIRDRLNEGQLDKCDLTLRDLDQIAETFVRILTGLLHQRIEYPEGASELAANGNEGGRRRSGGGAEVRP